MQTLKEKGFMKSVNGEKIFLKVDTVCVHGDTPDALSFIKALQ